MPQMYAKGEQLIQKAIIKYTIILQNAYTSMIFPFTSVQTCSEAYPTSHPVGTGGPFADIRVG